jgi:hypothetical protein
MLKPICYACHRFYRMKKSGLYFREGMPAGGGGTLSEPGLAFDQDWIDYKLWSGDLWHCLGCGHEIIVGTGFAPVRERHHEDYAEMVVSTNATFRVNDC